MTENKSQRGNTENIKEEKEKQKSNFRNIKIDCSTKTERSGNKKRRREKRVEKLL